MTKKEEQINFRIPEVMKKAWIEYARSTKKSLTECIVEAFNNYHGLAYTLNGNLKIIKVKEQQSKYVKLRNRWKCSICNAIMTGHKKRFHKCEVE